MNILYLSPQVTLIDFIQSKDDKVYQTVEKLDANFVLKFDWIISYGYRYKISPDVLNAVSGKAINLHISYLPWNRGADPNLWSWLEDTPKGVSIHYIDEGIDTGRLLAVRELQMSNDETLATSYKKLIETIEQLFIDFWPILRNNHIYGHPQDKGGSFHKSSDKEKYMHLLTEGWDTSVKNLIGRGA